MNLEAMAASISHEVRQPLAEHRLERRRGAALSRHMRRPISEEARLASNSMVSDSHRASQVFDNIRALFGKADQGHEPLDVNELAAGVLQTLREELNDDGITTRAALRPGLPLVMGHRGQLQEVFINLVRNAIEAMHAVKDGRRILQLRAERHGDNAVAVRVEDSGPASIRSRLDSIFDAFITTKAHGMGLGLALCRMIVERHAGQLSAAPADPRGSIFRVVLPAVKAGAKAQRQSHDCGRRTAADRFVIDDDASLREALARLFRSVGLQAKAFASAPEFLRNKLADGPSCLVLDVRLPGLSGLDFQAELAKADIDIPIVFMTGHGDIPMTVRAMKAGAMEFLPKPFRDQDMLDAVQVGLERDRDRRKSAGDIARLKANFATLTSREQEIMGLVTAGLMNKQIAGQIGVSEITVKVHRGSVMRKMEAKSLAELVRMADALGIRREPA